MSEKEKVTQDVSAEAKAKPAKENKPAKAKKDKKPGIGQRMGKFFRELKSELKKVAWPTKADTIKRTGIVIACAIVVGIIVWIFDSLAGAVIDALLSLFGK
ncbi:MAG: preprotein translocase subunit SecE [Ruminiclostridium sp.]|nr:preprotein translocase subunit SecE [Ruminiclostridium sp.]